MHWFLSREQLRYSLTAPSLHPLTLRSDMAGIAVPGKLYGIMAAGLPVAMVGSEASEPAQTILEEEIGFVVDPDQGAGTERLVENLLRLCDDDALRAEQGARARAALLAHYEQEVACVMWERMIARMNSTASTKADDGRGVARLTSSPPRSSTSRGRGCDRPGGT